MKNLLLRTITGIFFCALIVASILIHPLVTGVLFFIITILALTEYFKFVKKGSTQKKSVYAMAFLVFLNVTFFYLKMDDTLLLSIPITAILFFLFPPVFELFRKRRKPLNSISVSYFPIIWIVFPLSLIYFWNIQPEASPLIIALFIIIWLYDTLAYCAGSLVGKHPLFERISPKKSWEGFLFSLVITSLLSIGFYYIPYFNIDIFTTYYHWIGLAVLVIIFGTFGDLIESMFKRASKIKDSGKLLPGHGGILDRFDSLLLAVPVAYFYYWVIGIILSL